MRHVIALIILTSLASMAACGFHLRGALPFPAETRAVVIEASAIPGTLGAELHRALSSAGVRVVDKPLTDDTPRLRILREHIDRRVLSVDTDGKAREYELLYSVEFEFLNTADGGARHTLTLARELFFNREQILGSSSEEESVQRNLQRDMAHSIVRTLAAAGRNDGSN